MRVIAYLDANSAGQVMAAVAAGAAGVAVVFRVGWRRFTGLFSSKRRREAAAARSSSDET